MHILNVSAKKMLQPNPTPHPDAREPACPFQPLRSRAAVGLHVMSIADAGEITVLLSYSVCNEIKKPNTPAHVSLVVNRFNFSIEVNLTVNERQNYRDLVDSVRGDAEERNIAPDLFHVWEAAKNGGGYFISRNKRLLARSSAIAELLQIEVVTPAEFLDQIAMAHSRGMVPNTA